MDRQLVGSIHDFGISLLGLMVFFIEECPTMIMGLGKVFPHLRNDYAFGEVVWLRHYSAQDARSLPPELSIMWW